MKIKALIVNPHEIKRFLKNLGIQDYRAPPTMKTHPQRHLPDFEEAA